MERRAKQHRILSIPGAGPVHTYERAAVAKDILQEKGWDFFDLVQPSGTNVRDMVKGEAMLIREVIAVPETGYVPDKDGRKIIPDHAARDTVENMLALKGLIQERGWAMADCEIWIVAQWWQQALAIRRICRANGLVGCVIHVIPCKAALPFRERIQVTCSCAYWMIDPKGTGPIACSNRLKRKERGE